MTSIAYRKPKLISIPTVEQCPAGCTVSETIACYLRHERELRADLAAARGSDDAEVLRADLRAAERRIDELVDFGRRAS
jgi:hypothetical protein